MKAKVEKKTTTKLKEETLKDARKICAYTEETQLDLFGRLVTDEKKKLKIK